MSTYNKFHTVGILEALLLVATKPLTVQEIADVIFLVEQRKKEDNPDEFELLSPEQEKNIKKEITRQVQEVLESFIQAPPPYLTSQTRGIELKHVAGGYQLQTQEFYAPYIREYFQIQPARLTRTQTEILAIIAYKQPITRAEIDHVRGVDCSAGVKVLLDKKLVRIIGRKEEPGRPHLYGTTQAFLEFFRLQSLTELPTLRELQVLKENAEIPAPEIADKPLLSLQDLVSQSIVSPVYEDSEVLKQIDDTLHQARRINLQVAANTGIVVPSEQAERTHE